LKGVEDEGKYLLLKWLMVVPEDKTFVYGVVSELETSGARSSALLGGNCLFFCGLLNQMLWLNSSTISRRER
jgi:hypothetical protein